MGYATVSDVSARNTGRSQFGANTKPSASQVVGFINQTAAEIDAILRGRQYQLPVPTTATSALALLTEYNAIGAACAVERAAQNSDREKDTCDAWAAVQKMLAAMDLAIPKDEELQGIQFSATLDPQFSIATTVFQS